MARAPIRLTADFSAPPCVKIAPWRRAPLRSTAASTKNNKMPSILQSALPALQRAAPRISRTPFTCCQCLQKATWRPHRLTARLSGPAARFFGRPAAPRLAHYRSAEPSALSSKDASPLETLGKTIGEPTSASRKLFPETNNRNVAYWLLGSAASVFGIVVFGGLTRLTESGYVWSPMRVPQAHKLLTMHTV